MKRLFLILITSLAFLEGFSQTQEWAEYDTTSGQPGRKVHYVIKNLHLLQPLYVYNSGTYDDTLAENADSSQNWITSISNNGLSGTSDSIIFNFYGGRRLAVQVGSAGGGGGMAIGSAVSGGTAGDVLFVGTSTYLQESSHYRYDSTDTWLGIRTDGAAPSYALDLYNGSTNTDIVVATGHSASYAIQEELNDLNHYLYTAV